MSCRDEVTIRCQLVQHARHCLHCLVSAIDVLPAQLTQPSLLAYGVPNVVLCCADWHQRKIWLCNMHSGLRHWQWHRS